MRLLIIIFLLAGCATENYRVIRINELGWTFEVPLGMNFMDSAFDKNGNILKAKWDTFIDEPQLLLFNIQPKRSNYLNSIILIDTSRNSDWEQKNLELSRGYIDGIRNLPNYKILDTIISTQKIGGVNFQKEYVQCYNTIQKDTLYSYHFSRRYKSYEININTHYTDPELGKQYLQIIEKSKFED